MLKPQRELDIRLGCSWQVVVGEMYSFSVDFEQVVVGVVLGDGCGWGDVQLQHRLRAG